VVLFVSGVIVILGVLVTVRIVVFFVSGVIVILGVLVTVRIVVFFVSGKKYHNPNSYKHT
jgi:hypothetical protein